MAFTPGPLIRSFADSNPELAARRMYCAWVRPVSVNNRAPPLVNRPSVATPNLRLRSGLGSLPQELRSWSGAWASNSRTSASATGLTASRGCPESLLDQSSPRRSNMTVAMRVALMGRHDVPTRSVARPATWWTSGLRGTVMTLNATPW